MRAVPIGGPVDLLRGLNIGSGERPRAESDGATDPRGVKASSNIFSNWSHLKDAKAFVVFVDVVVWVVMIGDV